MAGNQYIQIHATDLQRIQEILTAANYTGPIYIVATDDTVYIRDTGGFLISKFPKTKQ